MAKILRIDASRKEFKCHKCGCTIEKGQPYLRGKLNFSKDIIRCTKCGLKSYELTTSDYTRRAGELQDWRETISYGDSMHEEVLSILEELRDDLQDRRDNVPENLVESPSAQLLDERIEGVESAISDIEDITFEDVCSSWLEDSEYDADDFDSFMEGLDESDRDQIYEEIYEKLAEMIDEALANLA